MKLLELAAARKPVVKVKKSGRDITATITIEETQISVDFAQRKPKAWWISFNIRERGKASSAKIFAAVLDHIRDWFKKEKPQKITLAGADQKRARIYQLFIRREIDPKKWEVEKVPFFDTFGFILTRK